MNKKGYVYMLAVVLLLGFLTACSRGNDYAAGGGWARTAGSAPMAPAATPASVPDAARSSFAMEEAQFQSADLPQFGGSGNVDWEEVAGQNVRHIIQSASMEMESESFNEVKNELRNIAPHVGGYIESEMLSATGRPRLSIVLRIPAARFDEVVVYVASLGTVHHQNQWAEDVTDQFYDMAGNLETRRIEEERVLALIEQATDIHELLMLEARLSTVRQAIASYLSRLNQMAGQITYSTLTVSLTCAASPEIAAAATLGERIGGAFGDSVDGTIRATQGFVVFLAGVIIPLALLGLFGLLIFVIIRKIRRRLDIHAAD